MDGPVLINLQTKGRSTIRTPISFHIKGFFSPLYLQFKFFAELFVHFPAKKHGSPCLNYKFKTINELPTRKDKQKTIRKRAHQEIQEGGMLIELGKHMNNNSDNNNNKMASYPYNLIVIMLSYTVKIGSYLFICL